MAKIIPHYSNYINLEMYILFESILSTNAGIDLRESREQTVQNNSQYSGPQGSQRERSVQFAVSFQSQVSKYLSYTFSRLCLKWNLFHKVGWILCKLFATSRTGGFSMVWWFDLINCFKLCTLSRHSIDCSLWQSHIQSLQSMSA